MTYDPSSARQGFVADPRRVLLGALLAPLVAALLFEIPTLRFDDYWPVVLLGVLSIITLYLPLVLYRLPRTRHPFWTCVLLGGISAPGILGYSVAIMASIFMADAKFAFSVLLITIPLGLVGGAVFWLCAVWRGEGWGAAG